MFNKIPLALAYDPISGNTSGLVEFYFQLSDVANVCSGPPSNGQVMTWTGDPDTGEWCPSAQAAATLLEGLLNVCSGAATPDPGQVLAWNVDLSAWCPSTVSNVSSLAALSDVCPEVTGVGENQVLAWNGTYWCPSTIVTGGGGGLTEVVAKGIYYNDADAADIPISTAFTAAVTDAGYTIATGTNYVHEGGGQTIAGTTTFGNVTVTGPAAGYAYFNATGPATTITPAPNSILTYNESSVPTAVTSTTSVISFLGKDANLGDLTNVLGTDPSPGQVLGWNAGTWGPVEPVTGGGGGVTTFVALTDVTLADVPFNVNDLIYAESTTGLNSISVSEAINSAGYLIATGVNYATTSELAGYASIGGDNVFTGVNTFDQPPVITGQDPNTFAIFNSATGVVSVTGVDNGLLTFVANSPAILPTTTGSRTFIATNATLSDVGDVTIDSVDNGDVLTYTAGVWGPQTPVGGGVTTFYALTDTPSTGAEDEILYHDGSGSLSSTTFSAAVTNAGYLIATGVNYATTAELNSASTTNNNAIAANLSLIQDLAGTGVANTFTAANTFNVSPVISTATENTYTYFGAGSALSSVTGTGGSLLLLGESNAVSTAITTESSRAFLGTNANLSDATDVVVRPESAPALTFLAFNRSAQEWQHAYVEGITLVVGGDGLLSLELDSYLSVPNRIDASSDGKGNLVADSFIYLSGTSSTETASLPFTDFAFNFISGASPVLAGENAHLIYASGSNTSSFTTINPSIYKTFLTRDYVNPAHFAFEGPVEVSATAPAVATGKIWLDTSETASGIDVMAVTTITASYSALVSDNVVLADCTASSLSATLPPASTKLGKVYNMKKVDSINDFYVIPDGSDTIDGESQIIIPSQYHSVTLVSDGNNWFIL